MIEIKGKEYIVRELTFEDAYLLSRILDKTGFSLKDFNADSKGKRVTEEQVKSMAISIGGDMVSHLARNYHKAHKEVKELLGSLIGISPEEFAKLPITAPITIVKELAKTMDLMDFLKQAAG